MNREFWRGRRVFVTGHTGFKGGWLSAWLIDAGCAVTGYSLPPDTTPSFFELCSLPVRMTSVFGDVRDAAEIAGHVREAQPDVVFHLAAQALVRRSLRQPLETLATNVLGTANVLEAIRQTPTVRAVVVVTSDKCYDPSVTGRPFREGDALGGNDPYSASKACAELVANAYAKSFFGGSDIGIATARAGNVFGGGDWAEDRVIPDSVRAIEHGEPVALRNPNAVRPWQHVLDPIAGYLHLAERLYREPRLWGGAWNFGPRNQAAVSVSALADLFHRTWGGGSWQAVEDADAGRETPALRLDSSKAIGRLGWMPRLALEPAMERTVAWYRDAAAPHRRGGLFEVTCRQILEYESLQRVAQA